MRAHTNSAAVAILLAWALPASAQTHFDQALRNSSLSAGSVRLGGNDGALSYAHPFALPPARGRYQPQAALVYGAGEGSGAYGVGWSLPASYVEWNPRASPGTDGFERYQFWLGMNGGRTLLVKYPADQTFGPVALVTFRPEIASSFFLATVLFSTSQVASVTAVDGVGSRYEFGYAPTSGSAGPRRFYLTKVTDVDGNPTTFTYATDPPNGLPLPYLASISYNYPPADSSDPFSAVSQGAPGTPATVISFDYDDATLQEPDSSRTVRWEAGGLFQARRLLSEVRVTRYGPSGGSLVRAWRFTYETSAQTGRKRLKTIVPVGRPNASSWSELLQLGSDSPAVTTFSYADTPVYRLGAETSLPDPADPSSLVTGTSNGCFEWFSHALDNCAPADAAAWVDLDGDHRPDQVWTLGSKVFWARNGTSHPSGPGTGAVPSFANVAEVPQAGAFRWPGRITFSHPTGENTGGSIPRTRLIDVNGDGMPDLVSVGFSGGCSGNSLTVQFAYSSNGSLMYAEPTCMDATAVAARWQEIAGAGTPLGLSYTTGGLVKVDLLDITGDGIIDYVTVGADGGWVVYPGYKTASTWAFGYGRAFTPSNVEPRGIRSVAANGTIAADLIDLNGDGLPDRVKSTGTPGSGWTVEYNRGDGFSPRPDGGNTVWHATADIASSRAAPLDGETTTAYGSELLPLSRGGRLDMVQIGSTACATTLSVQRNLGLDFGNEACIDDGGTPPPYLHSAISWHRTYPSPAVLVGVNAAWIDVDGDGQLDYVMHWPTSCNDEGCQISGWTVRFGIGPGTSGPGAVWAPPADTLIQVDSPGGARSVFSLAPSSWFGYRQRGMLRTVLWRQTTDGAHVEARTTEFNYLTEQAGFAWDEPTRLEPLGFLDVWAKDLTTSLVVHQHYSPLRAFAGIPISSESGIDRGSSYTWFATTSQTPEVRPIDSSWAASCSDGTTEIHYPAVLFVAGGSATNQDSGVALTGTRAVSCSAVDSAGNVADVVVTPDTASPERSWHEARVFPDVTSSQVLCKSCVLEEGRTTASGELSWRKYYYDAAPGSTAGAPEVTKGHPNYVAELTAGNRTSGTYEIGSRAAYGANGLLMYVRRDLPGQCSPVVVTTYGYGPAGLEPISETVSDQSGGLTTATSYDEAGNVIGRTTPYPAGTAAPSLSVGFGYDDFNRLVAVGRGWTSTGPGVAHWSVSDAVAAFSYLPPSLSAPGQVLSYSFALPQTVWSTFAWGQLAVVFPTGSDDVTESVTYVDGLGRKMQTRTRLGNSQAAVAGANISTHLGAGSWLVSGAVRFDVAGRVAVSAEPYLSNSGALDSAIPTGLPDGTMVGSSVYDERGRVISSLRRPAIGGALRGEPAASAQCTSNDVEGQDYRLATKTIYGAGALGAPYYRAYFAVTSQPTWRPMVSPPVSYLDAGGRVVWSREADGVTTHLLDENLGEGTVATLASSGTGKSVRQKSWFDKRGRVIQQVDDDASSSGIAAGARVRWFSYLPGGQLASANMGNKGVNYLYGSLGRLRARIDFGTSNPGSAWMRYDTPYDATFTNTAGRLAWSYTCASTWDCGSGAQVTRQAFGYDADGALVQKVAWWDGLPGSYGVQRTLRNDGRELSTAWPGVAGAPAVSTWYDSAGRPVRLIDQAGSELWRAEGNGAPGGAYDALGRLGDARMDGDHAQALASFSAYSGLLTGMASRRRTNTGGSFTDDLYHATWFAHEGARATGFTEVVSGMQHTYGYDDTGRLTGAAAAFVVLADSTRVGLVPPFSETYAFAPDTQASPNAAPWNLTRVTTASAVATYGYDAHAPEQLGTIGYSSGNTTRDVVSSDARGLVTEVWSQPGNDTVQLGYDAAMRLTTIGHNGTVEETLSYDASGQLARRTLPGASETRYYLDEALTIVVNAGGTTQWVHVSANGERVVSLPRRESGSYPAVYYHREQLGSVVATTTAGGNVGALYRYDPYGNAVVATGETAQNASELGYTGGLKLSEGLLHLQARAYWPRLRRFVQPDNVDRRRFSYVGGDPTNSTDPSGHMVQSFVFKQLGLSVSFEYEGGHSAFIDGGANIPAGYTMVANGGFGYPSLFAPGTDLYGRPLQPAGSGAVVVYIWNFRGKDVAYGHAAIAVLNADGTVTYISWWPRQDGREKGLGPPGTYSVDAIPNETLDDDKWREGDDNQARNPDRVIEIRGLDNQAILAWWNEFRTTQQWSTLSQNCATTVAEALATGGAAFYAGPWASHSIVWTPASAAIYASATAEGLAPLFP